MKLDYTLATLSERLEYVNLNLPEQPTPAELSKAADYLLYADPAASASGIILPTAWTRQPKFEPLDTLENSAAPIVPSSTSSKPPLNRARIREALVTHPYLAPTFTELWARIDAILAKGASATLAERHLLLELRNAQYPLYDILFPPYTSPILTPITPADPPEYGADMPVYPLGLYNPTWDSSSPHFSGMDAPLSAFAFNFEDPEHLSAFIHSYRDLDPTPSFAPFLSTFTFYREKAHLSEAHSLLLDMRLEGLPNAQIATILNSLYGTTYSANYTSTIFYSKIIPHLCAAARRHRLENDPAQPRKVCKDCGRSFPLTPDYFIRSSRSSTGFSCRCKQCEYLKRSK